MTENCKKAFEFLHEETWRKVRELYRRNGYKGSWQQFYRDHEERVKQDALRLRCTSEYTEEVTDTTYR